MRISVWQQFSSNHSAAFTVVGTFDSEDKARAVATELEAMLHKIDVWWERLSPEERMAWGKKTETPSLTPPETELSAEYKIDWPFSINWYHWVWDRTRSPVTAFRNFVVVNSPHYHIRMGPQPFDELLKRLGAEIAVFASESQSYPNTILQADLKCIAPGEKVAQSIVAAFEKYIRDEEPNPWLAYHNGTLDLQADELRQIVAQEIHETSIEERVREENSELLKQIMHAHSQRDDEGEARLQNQFEQLLKKALGGKPPINWQENRWILEAKSNARLYTEFGEYDPEVTHIQRDDTRLHFAGLRFENWDTGLQAIYAWLSDQGCSEIQFTFSQVRDTRREQP